MYRLLQKLVLFFSLLSALILLASCSPSGVGTIPSGTPDHGNGTPAVIPTPHPDPQPVLTAPPGATGAFYAFVRKNQLWVATNGTVPAQVTHFDFGNYTSVFWNQPLWSPGDRSIAFTMDALPPGLGGGGCPGPDYSVFGTLYILDTATMQLTKIVLPGDSGSTAADSPYDGYWHSIFWEDSTHLLAWHNETNFVGKKSDAAGLYRYNVDSNTLTQVIPLSSLGVATLLKPQAGLTLMLSMRYSSEELFYQIVEQGQIAIYRHSIVHPSTASSKVLTIGSEAWCDPQHSGLFVKPGWDVSPNGEQLVAQIITTDSSNQVVGTVQVLSLNDGSTTPLFAQGSSQMLRNDITLTWGPDSQTVIATSHNVQSPVGPYSATLANPSAMQQYTPDLAGQVAWRPDSSAFALQSSDALNPTVVPDVYIFMPGDGQGRLLLADAYDFTWG